MTIEMATQISVLLINVFAVVPMIARLRRFIHHHPYSGWPALLQRLITHIRTPTALVGGCVLLSTALDASPSWDHRIAAVTLALLALSMSTR